MAKVALVEKFVSVQGEGYNSGRPAFFIRLAGCNLRCDFSGEDEAPAYCDTPWTETREKLDVGEVGAWLQEGEDPYDFVHRQQLPPESRPMVVLTGGEPTMAPQFDRLVEVCKGLEFYVAVETNGTIYRDSFEDLDWVSCSPKTNVAQGNPFHGPPVPKWNPPALDPDVVGHLGENRGEYRFVISSLDDPEPEFHPAFRHYVSPAVRSDGTGQLWKEGFPGFVPGAVERCLEIVRNDSRWRLSTQAHKLWGVR